MKRKYGIGMRLIETPATVIMVLFVCMVSVPAIVYILFDHLKYKIKLVIKLIKETPETVETKEANFYQNKF